MVKRRCRDTIEIGFVGITALMKKGLKRIHVVYLAIALWSMLELLP
jgi:hypothetical protein